jgi:uncharacterized membrane protein HdeD (DUF308 family)
VAAAIRSSTAGLTRAGIPWWLILLQGIAALVLGFLLLTDPEITTVVLVQFLGVYWFIDGIFMLVGIFINRTGWGWKLFGGIVGILAGLIILRHPLWAALFVPTTVAVLIGIAGILMGVAQLVAAVRGGGFGVGLLGAPSALFGLLILFNPFGVALSLPFVFGILGIVVGILTILGTLQAQRLSAAASRRPA